jgi:hypothetical protein
MPDMWYPNSLWQISSVNNAQGAMVMYASISFNSDSITCSFLLTH